MKMLRNVKTGLVFAFHPLLARNKDMEPYESEQEDDAPDAAPDSIIIDKASKAELIAFAATNYGAKIDRSLSVADVRAQVRELVEADGQ